MGAASSGGSFLGSLAVPGQPVVHVPQVPSQLGQYSFIARFSPAGTCQWLRPIEAIDSRVKSLALDPGGNIIVGGGCGGPATFGSITNSGNSYDAFVAKYDAQGTAQWVQRFGSSELDQAEAVATDASGAVFVCGYFSHLYGSRPIPTASFGPFTRTPVGTYGFGDGFLAKLDARGTFEWVEQVRGYEVEFLNALAVNGRGEVYVSGAAYGGVLFGASTALPAATLAYQGYVAKYGPTGTLQWLQGYGPAANTPGDARAAGQGLATDGVGHVYVGGRLRRQRHLRLAPRGGQPPARAVRLPGRPG